MNFIQKNTSLFFLASLTLGLAPFFPEPHIIGKVQWLLGGAKGMASMDWFDVILHGSPFVLLTISLVMKLKRD